MVAKMSLLMFGAAIVQVVGLILAFKTSYYLPAALCVPIAFVFVWKLVPLSIAWDRHDMSTVTFLLTVFIVGGILVYASIYRKTGLILGGKLVEVNFGEASYFSVTTWVTLGYGDYIPPKDIQLVTSIEALTGYIVFGLFVSTLFLSIPETVRRKDEYVDYLEEQIKKAKQPQKKE